MNIFYLDENPEVCARYHCDKHVVKIILESAQLLFGAARYLTSGNENMNYEGWYKSTHINHPCAKWVRDSSSNFKYLVDLTTHLNNEFKYRYDRLNNHLSYDKLLNLGILEFSSDHKDLFSNSDFSELPKVVSEDCIMVSTIDSYRKYYNVHKSNLLSYTKRSVPKFVSNFNPY